MSKKANSNQPDLSTEERIKQAARAVFHRKGYSATKTRDIAEEAGINLALLNYYFRSKEKLFEQIMFETVFGFMQNMAMVFNDEHTTLHQKVELMVDRYIDMISREPEIPLFIMSEIRSNASAFLEKVPLGPMIVQSVFVRQYQKLVEEGKAKEPDPLQFLMNLLALVVFPFMASPLLKKIGNLKDKQFDSMMQERKRMIPLWIKAMLKA